MDFNWYNCPGCTLAVGVNISTQQTAHELPMCKWYESEVTKEFEGTFVTDSTGKPERVNHTKGGQS